jgi:splicing factor 3B subunit 3
LSYTPRKFISHPTNGYFYLIESDHRVMGEDAVAQKLDGLVRTSEFFIVSKADCHGIQRKQGKRIDDEVVQLPPQIFGRPKAAAGTWASCIRIIDPVEVSPLSSSQTFY